MIAFNKARFGFVATLDDKSELISAGVLRTARKLMDGVVS